MMEKLRCIVKQLNILLEKDYNCSSFDALSGQELLKILASVLEKLEIYQAQEENRIDFYIINILEAIKYVPENEITQEEFISGLQEGSKLVIYPILQFILNNQDTIKKRYNVSKFVIKIKIPQEFLKDIKVRQMCEEYNSIIEDYWKSYSDNKVEEKLALQSNELESDIINMKNDIRNLDKRLELQKSKIYLREEYLEIIINLVKEAKRKEKLLNQLEEDKPKLDSLTEKLHLLQSREKILTLDDFVMKNKEFKRSLEVYKTIYEDVNKDYEILQSVAMEDEPSNAEIHQLDQEFIKLQTKVNQLNHQKNQDPLFEAFIAQMKALNKNRAELSKQIIKIKMTNNEKLLKVDEISEILGGDFMRGKTYQEFVAELKQLSCLCKKYRLYLNSLENEFEILQKSLKMLYQENPNIKETIFDNQRKLHNEISKLSIEELSFQSSRLLISHRTIFRDAKMQEEHLMKARKLFHKITKEFDVLKLNFNEATDFILEDINDLEKSSSDLEKLIGMEEEDLKFYEEECEKFQDLIIRYSQGIIDTAGDVSYSELIKQQLDEVQNKCEELRLQVNKKEEHLLARKEELDLVKNVLKLIEAKNN